MALQKGCEIGHTKTAGDNVERKLQRFWFDYRRTPQTTTGKSPMEVLNQRKMTSRLDLLRPSLQGKVHKMQTQMKETHDRKGHERKFTSGECVCQELWARTKMVNRDDHSCNRCCVICGSTPGWKRTSRYVDLFDRVVRTAIQ